MTTNTTNPTSVSYRDAGVDMEAGDALVEQIKPYAKRTMRPEVLAGIGGFGSLFEMPKKFKNPVLVNFKCSFFIAAIFFATRANAIFGGCHFGLYVRSIGR